MFAKFERSWNLVKASAEVLKQDKELMLFPLFSTGAMVIVVLCFILPIFGIASLDRFNNVVVGNRLQDVIIYSGLFLFYVVQYFVIFFFNTALVGAAMIRLKGGDPTFQDGMRIAKSKIGVILGYALIAATVGMILRIIQERVGFIGKIIVGILGVGWTIATYLVVPVLADRDVGPIEAVKESAYLLKQTWGENVIGQAGIGFAFGVITFAVALCGAFLVFVASMSHSVFIIGLAVLVAIIALGFTALVQAALSGIYAAALYRYATDGEDSTGFNKDALQLAFAPKG